MILIPQIYAITRLSYVHRLLQLHSGVNEIAQNAGESQIHLIDQHLLPTLYYFTLSFEFFSTLSMSIIGRTIQLVGSHIFRISVLSFPFTDGLYSP